MTNKKSIETNSQDIHSQLQITETNKKSAFDTIDHSILVHSLHTDFGFTDDVLQWFSSYLTDRTHYVSLSNNCYAPVVLCHFMAVY